MGTIVTLSEVVVVVVVFFCTTCMYGTRTGQGLFPPIRTSNPPAYISSRIAGLAGSCENHFDFQEDGHRECLV